MSNSLVIILDTFLGIPDAALVTLEFVVQVSPSALSHTASFLASFAPTYHTGVLPVAWHDEGVLLAQDPPQLISTFLYNLASPSCDISKFGFFSSESFAQKRVIGSGDKEYSFHLRGTFVILIELSFLEVGGFGVLLLVVLVPGCLLECLPVDSGCQR